MKMRWINYEALSQYLTDYMETSIQHIILYTQGNILFQHSIKAPLQNAQSIANQLYQIYCAYFQFGNMLEGPPELIQAKIGDYRASIKSIHDGLILITLSDSNTAMLNLKVYSLYRLNAYVTYSKKISKT